MNYWIFTHISTSIYVSLFRDEPSSISRRQGRRRQLMGIVPSTLAKSRYPAGASCAPNAGRTVRT